MEVWRHDRLKNWNKALVISDRDAETPLEGPSIILLKIRENESSNFWHLRIDFYRKKGRIVFPILYLLQWNDDKSKSNALVQNPAFLRVRNKEVQTIKYSTSFRPVRLFSHGKLPQLFLSSRVIGFINRFFLGVHSFTTEAQSAEPAESAVIHCLSNNCIVDEPACIGKSSSNACFSSNCRCLLYYWRLSSLSSLKKQQIRLWLNSKQPACLYTFIKKWIIG